MSDAPDSSIGSVTSLSTAATLTDTDIDNTSRPKWGIQNYQKWPARLFSTVDSYLVILKTQGANEAARTHLKLVQKLCTAKNNTRISIQVKPADLSEIYPAAYMGFFPKDTYSNLQIR